MREARVEPTSAAALAQPLLIDRNDVAGAIPFLEQAVSLEPHNTIALYRLRWPTDSPGHRPSSRAAQRSRA
jgi:hypothetical protein